MHLCAPAGPSVSEMSAMLPGPAQQPSSCAQVPRWLCWTLFVSPGSSRGPGWAGDITRVPCARCSPNRCGKRREGGMRSCRASSILHGAAVGLGTVRSLPSMGRLLHRLPGSLSWPHKASLPFVLLPDLMGIASSGCSAFCSNQIIAQNSRILTK